MTSSSVDLALEKPKFLILREHSQRTFTDTDVTTVTRLDTRWQGGLIGFVAGYVPVTVGLCNSGDGEEAAWNCLGGLILAGPIFGLAGAAIGMFIDGSINEVVYRSDAHVHPVTITVSPLLKPKSAGASLRLGF